MILTIRSHMPTKRTSTKLTNIADMAHFIQVMYFHLICLVLHCMHGIRSHTHRHYDVLIFSLKSNLELSLNTTSVQQFQVSFRHDLDALFYHNYVQTPLNHCNSSSVYITLFRFTLPLI